MTIPVARINHAVLFVRDLDRSVGFYRTVFGLEEVASAGGKMAFLRAPGSTNHHDLGLAAVGPGAAAVPEQGTAVGLYHLAWEVPTIADVARAHDTLVQLGALTGASDHGATKSVYGVDPDGNEFEIMWLVPRDQWGEYERRATTRPLDLERELARFGSP